MARLCGKAATDRTRIHSDFYMELELRCYIVVSLVDVYHLFLHFQAQNYMQSHNSAGVQIVYCKRLGGIGMIYILVWYKNWIELLTGNNFLISILARVYLGFTDRVHW